MNIFVNGKRTKYSIMPSDTCIIACYFNPVGSSSRGRNFMQFYRKLAQADIPVFIIELVFGNAVSALSGIVKNLKIIRSNAILWQKERLLNRLIPEIPMVYKKIIWTDVDILFGNKPQLWISQVSEKLADTVVVQGFASMHRLNRFGIEFWRPDVVESFAKVLSSTPAGQPISGNYHRHGHTGYTWAARRDFLEDCGFYDGCMSGSGDHLMAHAFCGDLDADCFNQIFQDNAAYRDHFMLWAERVATKTGGQLDFVDCQLKHLWHGSPKNRKYRKRDNDLTDLKFNPATDLSFSKSGAWEWSTAGQRFVPWALEYFNSRQEL